MWFFSRTKHDSTADSERPEVTAGKPEALPPFKATPEALSQYLSLKTDEVLTQLKSVDGRSALYAKLMEHEAELQKIHAFNPAELFLASIAACILKGIERVTPLLGFELAGVDVQLNGVRQDSPPRMISVTYEIVVETSETDQRLELLHKNVRKFGTISNTVAEAANLSGSIRREQTA
jgi:uncharacterized OsmC-like protein